MGEFRSGAKRTRRALVGAGAAACLTAWLPGFAQERPAAASAQMLRFLAISRIITGHQDLDAAAAQAYRQALSARLPIDRLVERLAGLAAKVDTPEKLEALQLTGELRAAVASIRHVWYTGAIDDSADAQTVDLPSALAYRVTSDGVGISSTCRGPTGSWVIAIPDPATLPVF